MYDIPATNSNGSTRPSYRYWPSVQIGFAERTVQAHKKHGRVILASEMIIEQYLQTSHIDAPATKQDHTKLQLLRPHIDRKLYHRENLHRSGSGKLLLRCATRVRQRAATGGSKAPTHSVPKLASLDMSQINFDSRNKIRKRILSRTKIRK